MSASLPARIVLTGFMGGGKSHVGRLLAHDLGLPFLDTDRLVELEAGRSIPRLFEEEGEAGFRARERAAVRTAASLPRAVIATGGGTLVDPANQEALRPDAVWITLDASPDEVLRRVGDRSQRPLLHGPDPAGRIARLKAEREPVYALSHHRLDTTRLRPREVAEAVLRLLGQPRRRLTPQRKQEVHLDLPSRAYSITIMPGLLEKPSAALPEPPAAAVLIGPPLPLALYGSPLLKALRRSGCDVELLPMPDGEEAKNLTTAARLYDGLVERGADRGTWLFAVGGGVCGDAAGFVAATYQRGVPFVQVPTTLLAQVDASVGGKVAVNHAAGKNLIGAFYQPAAVLIDPISLISLPEREYRQGLAEIAKYGVLVGDPFFAYLEANAEALKERSLPVLVETIRRSCEIKAQIVMADETDRGERMLLNLGHTFGHALETLCGYGRLAHGEAVAIGMRLAADLAVREGRLRPEERQRMLSLVERLGLPLHPEPIAPMPEAEAMMAQFRHDKKSTRKGLRFVLPEGIGRVRLIEDVAASQLRKVLESV